MKPRESPIHSRRVGAPRRDPEAGGDTAAMVATMTAALPDETRVSAIETKPLR